MFDQQPELWCMERGAVAIAVLATYTWSFLQFTLVFTATSETVPDTKELPKVTYTCLIHKKKKIFDRKSELLNCSVLTFASLCTPETAGSLVTRIGYYERKSAIMCRVITVTLSFHVKDRPACERKN